ncbi:MAG: site-specific DNA-methyltransferase [Methanobrevibacter sp. CfCl-M3]
MMFPCLKLARNVLTDDGVIIVTIDHYELNNLIDICGEIFGEYNRLGIVTIVHKPEGRQHAKFFSSSNEFMLVYAKNKDLVSFNQVVLNEEKKKEFVEKDELGNFKWKNFIRGDILKSQKPNGFYPIYVSSDLKNITLEKKDGYVEIFPIDNKNKERAWIVLPEGFENKLKIGEIKANFNEKTNNIEILYKIREQQVLTTHWIEKKYNATAYGTRVLNDLFGEKIFDFPKSVHAVEDIIKIVVDNDSTILDFFSGSATTAHAIMNINKEDNGKRKFIMVQLPFKTDDKSEAYKAGYKTITEIGKERIRRAGDKILKESNNKDLDIGFKVFKLDSSNLKKWDPDYKNPEQAILTSVDNIKDDRTEFDLLYEIMLKYGIDLTLPIKEYDIANKKIYSVGFGALLICLDDEITSEIATEIIKLKNDLSPETTRVVFKDNGFKSDSDKTNIKESLKTNNIDEFITI